MKITSALLTDARGSIGGMTASRNRGGLYLRGRTTPTNPNSTAQVAVRANLGALSVAWSNTLTDEQRESWNLYAANVSTPGSMGSTIQQSGLGWYVAVNSLREYSGLARVQNAPATFTLAPTPSTVVFDSAASGSIEVAWNPSQEVWDNTAGGGLIVQCGRPTSIGVNFFRGPFRFADFIPGASTPPVSPQTITTPFAIEPGQRVWIRVRSLLADGRISPPVILGPQAVV